MAIWILWAILLTLWGPPFLRLIYGFFALLVLMLCLAQSRSAP